MLGFVRTDNQSLVWCLGDPQRAVAAYHELLRRGKDATGAIRAGLHHQNPAVREGSCRLLDHLVDTDSMSQLIAMTGDPDARVRTAAFHALACDRCKSGTCAPGADEVLEPALQHLASDPDAQVRARAAELSRQVRPYRWPRRHRLGDGLRTGPEPGRPEEGRLVHARRHHLPTDHAAHAQVTGQPLITPPANGHFSGRSAFVPK